MASASRKSIPTPPMQNTYGEDVEGGDRPMPAVKATSPMNTRIVTVADISVPQPKNSNRLPRV